MKMFLSPSAFYTPLIIHTVDDEFFQIFLVTKKLSPSRESREILSADLE